ncbi:cytochrome P450, partial [Melanogaster broomeanus]
QPWLTFTTWASTYGKVYRMSLFNQNTIFLNTEEAARVLLKQHSTTHAGRPLHDRIRELHGLNFSIGFLQYGDEWRLQRKVFHHAFHAPVTLKYWPIQIRKAHELVQSLIQAPEDTFEHIQTFAASTIMLVVYGYEVSSTGDPYVNIVEKLTHAVTTTLAPTRVLFLLTFPFLLKIPTWAPGGGFQRRAIELKELGRQMMDVSFKYVQDALAQGTAAPSMVSAALKDIDPEKDADQIERLKCITSSAYGGVPSPSSCTSASLAVFFLAMALYPEAQRRAQAEIDAVIGNDRLPTFEDRRSMPFLEATLRKILRWHPVAPLGLAHQAREVDSFDCYHIPKGMEMAVPHIIHLQVDSYSTSTVRTPGTNFFAKSRRLWNKSVMTTGSAPTTRVESRETNLIGPAPLQSSKCTKEGDLYKPSGHEHTLATYCEREVWEEDNFRTSALTSASIATEISLEHIHTLYVSAHLTV